MKRLLVGGGYLMLALVSPLAGCATEPTDPTGDESPPSDVLLGDLDLVAIPKSTSVDEVAARASRNLRSNGSGEFYLAIKKSALEERWFWTTFLEELQPGGPTPQTLGTRVVRFRIQNGKLFVFDADNRRVQSDVFEPDLIIDAFEIVDDNAPFMALPGAGKYVLIDPAAGGNRFGALADGVGTQLKLETELSFVEDYKAWPDGASFAHIFAAYSDVPFGGLDGDTNDYRVAATTRVTLRRYYETPGYAPTPNPGIPFYFTSDVLGYDNPVQPLAAKWAIHPGMTPIKWKIGREILMHDATTGANLSGAIERGIESWNDVLGFVAFEAELAGPKDRMGDDHHNFFIVDHSPQIGYAYADWRLNPNTNEIRGASVYFSSAFFTPQFPDDPEGADAGAPVARPAKKGAKPMRLTWHGSHAEPLCEYGAHPSAQLTGVEKLESYVQHVAAHEIGHTLGLRHNFKGSLVPPTSSVMEYSIADARIAQPGPGVYDAEAIQYLYGLSPLLPSQPFCTDEQTLFDPDCVLFDPPTPQPLFDYQLPQYQAVADFVRDSGMPDDLADLYLAYYGTETMGYVRGGDPFSAQTAWSTLVTNYCDYPFPSTGADQVCGFWFRDLVTPHGVIANPIADETLHAMIAATGGAALVDANRGFAMRRDVVDGLRTTQQLASYLALLDARATLSASIPTLDPTSAALTRDLVARIDAATSPYFD